MNVANLQLQGLYIAIAAINEVLVQRGVLTRSDIDTALRTAEQVALADDRVSEDMNPASRDALAFPARLLAIANGKAGDVSGFSELARLVGETKPLYNDQR